jgi:hypothetical protein
MSEFFLTQMGNRNNDQKKKVGEKTKTKSVVAKKTGKSDSEKSQNWTICRQGI